MTDKKNNLSDLTYEQAFTELESIVELLESGQKPLDEALKLYERGQMLAQYCAALLDQAELKIKQLNPAAAKANQEE